MSCDIPAHMAQCDEHIVVKAGPSPYSSLGLKSWVITLETEHMGERVMSKARISYTMENTPVKGELLPIQYEVARMKLAIEEAIRRRYG